MKKTLIVMCVILAMLLASCGDVSSSIGETSSQIVSESSQDTSSEVSQEDTTASQPTTSEETSSEIVAQTSSEEISSEKTSSNTASVASKDTSSKSTAIVVAKEYTVTFDATQSCGPDNVYTRKVKSGQKVTAPNLTTELGYALGWYYTDGNDTKKWDFNTSKVTENVTLTAKLEYATYELPIINIDTNGAAIKSKEDYTDMTFSIENCDGELENVTGGIRLRGNSTMGFAKKPYRIKFDKKQSLFGLPKAKSWVLLAEYLDPSALHNYTAFKLASEFDGLAFTPSPYKVNIYLNGEYVGLYTLCEQVQENEGRMNIELDEIDPNFTELKQYNFFISMDFSSKNDAGATLDETYFYLEDYDRYFELKYPEKDQFPSEAQFQSFMTQLKAYTKEVLDACVDKDLDKIKAEVNVDSLIDYLIVDIIMGEKDHYRKSFHMYYTNTSSDPEENGKLNFGPIWDYDWSLNTPWTDAPNESYEINNTVNYSNYYFQAVDKIPELKQMLKTRYNLCAKEVLADYIADLDNLVSSMQESIDLNEERWYTQLDSEISQKNITFLKDFLKARKLKLDELWSLE